MPHAGFPPSPVVDDRLGFKDSADPTGIKRLVMDGARQSSTALGARGQQGVIARLQSRSCELSSDCHTRSFGSGQIDVQTADDDMRARRRTVRIIP